MDNGLIIKAIMNQAQYCKDHETPHFAPRSGKCEFCGRFIYKTDANDMNGYSPEYAKEHLITGCPICHKSFVD
ncbi:MAG: hypothetical protein J6Y20_07230 [Lachnospiraceae bacterium]|nr:hypothetical protein [Lachnospiraceae bacterium]